jgi:3-deoxy-manno-octulosonate cytidylyltransferase (CMP-KDO synthetase)
MTAAPPLAPPPDVVALIPARYGATRFPGKPLAQLWGKPMITWVRQKVAQCDAVSHVFVATDDDRIAQAVQSDGGQVVMTRPDHPSGTDRVWEAYQTLLTNGTLAPATHQHPRWILNVQGDEPLIDPRLLAQLIATAQRVPDAQLITAVTPFASAAQWQSPNCVKAVTTLLSPLPDAAPDDLPVHRALYFSRALVPHQAWESWLDAPASAVTPLRHLGVYLYRADVLERLIALPPSPLEQLESLEQLRAIESGIAIHAVQTDHAPQGIDTPQDLAQVQQSHLPT